MYGNGDNGPVLSANLKPPSFCYILYTFERLVFLKQHKQTTMLHQLRAPHDLTLCKAAANWSTWTYSVNYVFYVLCRPSDCVVVFYDRHWFLLVDWLIVLYWPIQLYSCKSVLINLLTYFLSSNIKVNKSTITWVNNKEQGRTSIIISRWIVTHQPHHGHYASTEHDIWNRFVLYPYF